LPKNQLHARGELNHGNNQHDDLQAAIGLDVAKAERKVKRQKQSNELNRRKPKE